MTQARDGCSTNELLKTEETTMLKKLGLVTFAAAVLVMALPSVVTAYGAAHVGYTHVGPSGVYHTGETVSRGPGGTYATTDRTYRGDTSGGATYERETSRGAYGGATEYHYTPTYGGATYGGATYGGATSSYHYGYVR